MVLAKKRLIKKYNRHTSIPSLSVTAEKPEKRMQAKIRPTKKRKICQGLDAREVKLFL